MIREPAPPMNPDIRSAEEKRTYLTQVLGMTEEEIKSLAAADASPYANEDVVRLTEEEFEALQCEIEALKRNQASE